MHKRLGNKSNFFIVGNGYQYNIIGALEDYLKMNNISYRSLRFPLFKKDNKIEIKSYEGFGDIKLVKISYLVPPLSYLIDPFIVFFSKLNRNLIAMSFNPILTFVLIFTKFVFNFRIIHWHVDFSPKRFQNRLMNYIYLNIDSFISKRVDLNIEISEQSLEARQIKYGYDLVDKSKVIGVGIWLKDIKQNSFKVQGQHSIIFIGNLRQGQGVENIIQLAEYLARNSFDAKIEVVGGGTFLDYYINMAKSTDAKSKITFLGELNYQEMEIRLANASLALAPYEVNNQTFSYYSDPSKIKQYASKGIPIIATKFSPLIASMEKKGLLITAETVEEYFSNCKSVLENEKIWYQYSNKLIAYAKENSWEDKFSNLLNFKT
jgi:glycosyltransferase involved in cell wall biosynthesis